MDAFKRLATMKRKIIYLIICLYPVHSFSFVVDDVIHRPNLNTENFLDINYVQFTEALNEQWYQVENGIRLSDHSLSHDLLYTNTEIKLFNELSEFVNVRLNYQQEIFYSDKDILAPQLEVEIKPSSKHNFSFSIIGTAEYEKEKSDIGFALTFGEVTSNFFRISDIEVNYFYNEKNHTQALFLKYQHVITIETAYQISPFLKFRFMLSDFTPMEFVYNDQISLFEHKGYEYDGFIKYQFNKNNHFKLSLKGFETDKSLTGTTDQSQQLKYDSIDLKWLTHQQQPYQLTFGLRDDDFTNEIISVIDSSTIHYYLLTTRQIYSTISHSYAPQKSWELGLYIGLTKEPYDFNDPIRDFSQIYESKFAATWIYQSSDKTSSIFLHSSWDLDGNINDPWDGGGITFQSTF